MTCVAAAVATGSNSTTSTRVLLIAMASRKDNELKSPLSTSRGGSVTTVNSATRGVPEWLKAVFANDLEEKGGPHQFGVGKPHSLADLFEPEEGEEVTEYANYESRIINLHSYWKTYNRNQFTEKVLKKYNITPFKDRRNKSNSKSSSSKRKPQDVNIVESLTDDINGLEIDCDWSLTEDEDNNDAPRVTRTKAKKPKPRKPPSIVATPVISEPRTLFPPARSPRTMSGTVRSDIVVNSDGTVVGTFLCCCLIVLV